MKLLINDAQNFGDRLNEYIWPHYLTNIDNSESELIVGVGSFLNQYLPKNPTKYILGSGIGPGGDPVVDNTWRIKWVRGPYSACKLGLDLSSAITDGAVLLADLSETIVNKTHEVSFMPHYGAITDGPHQLLEETCKSLGINFIDPTSPVIDIIYNIKASKHLITEALHGAIVADAFRVPWHPVTRRGILSIKWQDWVSSMDLEYYPTLLAYRTQWFRKERHPRLSRRIVFPLLRPLSEAAVKCQLSHIVRQGNWMMSDSKILSRRISQMKRSMKTINT